MSLIERLFQHGYDIAAKFPLGAKRHEAAVDLSQSSRYILTVLRLLTGKIIEIKFSRCEEIIVNNFLVTLPGTINIAEKVEDNKSIMTYAVLMLAGRFTDESFRPNRLELIPELEARVQSLYPGSTLIMGEVDRIGRIYPEVRKRVFARFSNATLGSIDGMGQGNSDSSQRQDMATIHASSEIKVVDLKSDESSPLVHSFEKIHTAEEYQSGNKQVEDAENLEDERRALEELNFSAVVRTNQVAKSYGQSGVLLDYADQDIDEAELYEPKIFPYAEWFYRQGRYKQEWCRVYEESGSDLKLHADLSASARACAGRLRKFIGGLMNQRRLVRGCCDGPEVDLDAVTRYFASPVEFRDSNVKLFQQNRPAANTMAVLILVDCSLSSDSWVENRRILDVEKELASVLALAMEGTTIQVEFASFSSQTRKCCRYQILKSFSDVNSAIPRINSLQPSGYTRLGAVLRHATKRLGEIRARDRAIFIFTDARPTDYDAYEGKHGIADVKKAILEARIQGITTIGLVAGRCRERHHLDIFGPGKYHYVLEVADFIKTMQLQFLHLLKS